MIYRNKLFSIVTNVFVILLIISCIVPFLILISSSFSSESALQATGYGIFPKDFSLDAYKYLWGTRSSILRSYGMSILITGIGTTINILMTVLFAYPLSRPDLPGRRAISFFLFFTMLFNGGFVPTYLVYSNIFHINDTLASMIVPYLLMNAFYVIMVRSYLTNNVPLEVLESSKIDGAHEFQILGKLVIPMSKPIMATIGLMSAIAYWNNWTNGIYFITEKTEYYGIQNYLNTVLANVSFLQSHSDGSIDMSSLPSIGIRMALAVIALLPILIIYPFFQKSFVKGITVGSVKG